MSENQNSTSNGVRNMFGVFVALTNNSNINQDPNTKLPRQDPYDGHTYGTDVCIKYNVRRSYETLFPNAPLLMSPGANLANEFRNVYPETVEVSTETNVSVVSEPKKGRAGKKKGVSVETLNVRSLATENMLKKYPDVGVFGLVGNVTDHKLNNVRGALNISFVRSLNPSVVQEETITRCVSTEAEKNSENTMGTKSVIKHAAHVGYFHFNATLAEKNGVTQEDQERWLLALANAFQSTGSASKGWTVMTYVGVFEWQGPLGFEKEDLEGARDFILNFDRVRLENRIKIKPLVENPMRWSDYEVTVDKTDLHPNIHYREIKHS